MNRDPVPNGPTRIQSQPKLFQHNLPDATIRLDDVTLNDIATVRQFALTNLEDETLVIQLQSSTPCIKFQLRNDLIAGAASPGAADNVVFNLIGLIDCVSLAPRQTMDILIIFTANPVYINVVTQSQPFNGAIQLTGMLRGTEQVERLAFTSRVCTSVMTITPSALRFSIDVGRTQPMEFTVANCSDVPLRFVPRLQSILASFSLMLCEYEDPGKSCLGTVMTLQPHHSQKFSISTTVKEDARPGTYTATLQVDNLRDSRNTCLVQVHVKVTTGSQIELISVPAERGCLMFDPVYRGHQVSQPISISNSYREPVTVRLQSELAEAVYFSLERSEGETSALEEIIILPGKSTRVFAHYTPPIDADAPPVASVKFSVTLLATAGEQSQTLNISASCVVHRSSVSIPQTTVNFGDVKVGGTKKSSLAIINKSELPASVTIKYNSRVIQLVGHEPSLTGNVQAELKLPPNSATAFELCLTPRRVNPRYKKQLIVINNYDSSQQFLINVEANNIASDESKLHDALYLCHPVLPAQLQTTCSADIEQHERRLDETSHGLMMTVVCGLMSVRAIMLRKVVSEEVSLSLSTTSQDFISLYTLPNSTDAETSMLAFDYLSSMMVSWATRTDERDPDPSEIESVAQVRDDISNFVKNKLLPLPRRDGTYSMVLDTDEPAYLYVVIQRPAAPAMDWSHFVTKEDSLSIRVGGVEQPRFLRISYRMCASILDLGQGQKNKQFGKLYTGERKQIRIAVHNPSAVPLYFCVWKQKSVSASFLKVENADARYFGFVRPLARRDLEVTFTPGLKGSFKEFLSITNILDPENEEVVTVKADVEKLETFEVIPLNLNLGEITLGISDAATGKIVLTNTSMGTKKRDFRVKFDGSDANFKFSPGVVVSMTFELEHTGSSSGSARRIEDEIERLEHKLRIYIRKGKKEKSSRATKRLDDLRRALLGESNESVSELDAVSAESSEDESDAPVAKKRNAFSSPMLYDMLRRDGVPLPPLSSQEQLSLQITVQVKCPDRNVPTVPIESRSMTLIFYEANDLELFKTVRCDLSIMTSDVTAEAVSPLMPPSPLSRTVSTSEAQLIVEESPDFPFDAWLGTPVLHLHEAAFRRATYFEFFVRALAPGVSFVVLSPSRLDGSSSVATDVKFRFSPQTATANDTNPIKILAEAFPRSVGPQRYILCVKNLRNRNEMHSFVISLNPMIVDNLLEISPPIVDFKTVTLSPVDGDYETLPQKELTIKNTCEHAVHLLARSNLPSQIMLFEDAVMNTALRPLLIEPGASATIYVTLLPKIDLQRLSTFKSRHLTAGITFEISDCTNGIANIVPLRSVVLRVDATIGVAVLKLREGEGIDFGEASTASSGLLRGNLVLENPSDAIPVSWKIDRVKEPLSVPEGNLNGVLLPGGTCSVPVSVASPGAGYYHETISVSNRSAHQPPLQFAVKVLFTDGTITVRPAKIDFGVIPVCPSAGSGSFLAFGDARAKNYVTTITVRNKRAKDIELVAKTDAPVVIGSEQVATKRPTIAGHCALDSQGSMNVICQLFSVPSLSTAQLTLLKEGSAEEWSSTMFFEVARLPQQRGWNFFRHDDLTVGRCVAATKITAKFAISSGKLLENELALGTVGANKNWEDLRFTFHVQNNSLALPLVLRPQLPKEIRLADDSVNVAPGATIVVEGLLLTKEVRSSPNTKLDALLKFVNDLNPTEVLQLPLYGKVLHAMWRFVIADALAHAPSSSSGQASGREMYLPPIQIDPSTFPVSIVLSEGLLSVQSVDTNVSSATLTVISNGILPPLGVDLGLMKNDPTSMQLPATWMEMKGSKLDLKVRLAASEDTQVAQLAQVFFAPIKNEGKMTFDGALAIHETSNLPSGKLILGTVKVGDGTSQDEEIAVSTSMMPFSTFNVSSNKVVMSSMIREGSFKVWCEQLEVENVTRQHTVNLCSQAFLRSHSASVANVWCEPANVRILPAEKQVIQIFVKAAEGTENSLDQSLCALFRDAHCPCGTRLVNIALSSLEVGASNDSFEDRLNSDIVEAAAGAVPSGRNSPAPAGAAPFPPTQPATLPTAAVAAAVVGGTSTPPPLLEIRNCAAIGDDGRFVLALRPSVLDAPVEHDIKIANKGGLALDYTVAVVSQYPRNWLHISSKGGKLKPQEAHNLRIVATCREIGSCIAQILVTNLAVAADLKLIRVTIDVCATGPIVNTMYELSTSFPLVMSRMPKSPGSSVLSGVCSLDMGTLHGIESSTHRHFDLINRSEVTEQEFQLSVAKPLRFYRILADERASPVPCDPDAAGVDLKVAFSLAQHHWMNFTTVTVPPTSAIRVFLIAWIESVLPASATSSFFVDVDIVVKCRLVRDAQKIVSCRLRVDPQSFAVSTTQLRFSPEQMQLSFTVTPLETETAGALNFQIFGDTPCFSIDPQSGRLSEPSTITVQAIEERIREKKANGVRFFQELIAIYNTERPLERRFVSLLFVVSVPSASLATIFSQLVDNASRGVHNELLERRVHSFFKHFKGQVAELDKIMPIFKGELESVFRLFVAQSAVDDGDDLAAGLRDEEAVRSLPSATALGLVFESRAMKALHLEFQFICDEIERYHHRGKQTPMLHQLACFVHQVLAPSPFFSLWSSFPGLEEFCCRVHLIPPALDRWRSLLRHLENVLASWNDRLDGAVRGSAQLSR